MRSSIWRRQMLGVNWLAPRRMSMSLGMSMGMSMSMSLGMSMILHTRPGSIIQQKRNCKGYAKYENCFRVGGSPKSSFLPIFMESECVPRELTRWTCPCPWRYPSLHVLQDLRPSSCGCEDAALLSDSFCVRCEDLFPKICEKRGEIYCKSNVFFVVCIEEELSDKRFNSY